MPGPVRRALFALRFGELNLAAVRDARRAPADAPASRRRRPAADASRRSCTGSGARRSSSWAAASVPGPRLHHERRVPLRGAGALGGTRVNYMRGVGRRHGGRVHRRGDDVPDRHRRPDHARVAGGLPHPVHCRRANARGGPRASALPAGAVRRPGPDLGDLPHRQRRRLLYARPTRGSGRPTSPGRSRARHLRNGPAPAASPQLRPTTSCPPARRRAASGSCSRRRSRPTARRT